MPNHRGACLHHRNSPPYGASVTAAAAGHGECAWRDRLQGGSVRDRTPGVCPRDGLVIGVVFGATCSHWAYPSLWRLKTHNCVKAF